MTQSKRSPRDSKGWRSGVGRPRRWSRGGRLLLSMSLLAAAGCLEEGMALPGPATAGADPDGWGGPGPEPADPRLDPVLSGHAVPGQIVVRYRDIEGRKRARSRATLHGTRELRALRSLPFELRAVEPGEPLEDAVRRLSSDPDVLSAEPNARVYALGMERLAEPAGTEAGPDAAAGGDAHRGYQWHMDQIGVEDGWAWSRGSGATVAVVDTGVNPDGEDTPIGLIAGRDVVGGDDDARDDNGHGTHVAGTIAQASDNGLGVVGVAPDVTLLPVKVLDRYGSGSAYDVAEGIEWAVDQGADVINLSLGASSSSTVEQQAIRYAYDHGAVVIAASGNSGAGQLDYPARYSETISVGATRVDESVTSYSNRGTGLDLVAPGGDTGVDQDGDGYTDGVLQETFDRGTWGYYFMDGTSMAAPHVAGAAAIAVALGATGGPEEVREILSVSARDIGAAGYDTTSGHGILDVGTMAAAAAAAGGGGGGGGPTDADGDGHDAGADCDDSDPAVHPGATETCDGVDDDCDGTVDEGCGGEDGTPPVITGVTVGRAGGRMRVRWTTDEPADSAIAFTGYGSRTQADLVTSHQLTLAIRPSQTYEFWVSSTDVAGNASEAGPFVSAP
ncbi:S8 family peptidase [Myxococcota bacterium]|nr:S8 family peptidase [Myxococcota bacterium]